MRKWLSVWMILSVACGLTANGPIPRQESAQVEGEWIVRFKAGIPLEDDRALTARLTQHLNGVSPSDLTAQRIFPKADAKRGRTANSLDRYVLIRAHNAVNLDSLLAKHPDIDSMEPNYLAFLNAPPFEYDADFHWHLAAVNAPDTWDHTFGDAGQIIAVIDTGVDLNHPDLRDRIWTNTAETAGDRNGDGCPGVCGVDDDGDGLIDEDHLGRQPGDPGYHQHYFDDDDENGYIDDFQGWDWSGLDHGNNNPNDNLGHGTHIAGVIAATANNGVPGLGICPSCTIMPLKAFNSNGVGSFADIALAVDYAYRKGATVINMSFSSVSNSTLLRDVLLAAAPHAVLVASAGNDGLSIDETPSYPAAYDFVLGVESQDQNGDRSSFSNYGYETAFPGESISSAYPGGGYATWSGTSMAAPLAAGLAGLVRTHHPDFSPPLVQGQIQAAAADAGQALELVPEPDLVLGDVVIVDQSCDVCDGDGIADAGETIELRIGLRNRWGAATAVSAVLSTNESDLDILQNTADYGGSGSLQTVVNPDGTFQVHVSPTIPSGAVRQMSLAVTADGVSTNLDFEFGVTRVVNKSGVLDNETWLTGYEYHLDGDILVQDTLNIQPGVKITWDSDIRLIARGELLAVGDVDNPIVMKGSGGRLTIEELVTTFNEDWTYDSGDLIRYCQMNGEVCLKHRNYSVNFLIEYSYLDLICPLNFAGIVARGSHLSGTLDYAYWGGIMEDNTLSGDIEVTRAVIDANNIPQVGSNNIITNGPSIGPGPIYAIDLTNQYWGATHPDVIPYLIWDVHDEINLGSSWVDPFLTAGNPLAPAVVETIHLNPPDADLFAYHAQELVDIPSTVVGEDRVTFTVTFSREMDTSMEPLIYFGEEAPYTTHIVHENGTWLDNRTWQAQKDISIYTGDGVQTILVTRAKDLQHFPVSEYDTRHSFTIDTSDVVARSLGSTSGDGAICLNWSDGDEQVIGYNVYRAATEDGVFVRVNSAIVAETTYMDLNVEPGQEYCYQFRPMTTGLQEGPASLVSCNVALDGIEPEIQHLPITESGTGRLLTIFAQISDNLAVASATLYYRHVDDSAYASITMVNAVDDQFTANIPASAVLPPGLDYYIAAYDGRNTTQHGSSTNPHHVGVVDQPVINSISPLEGPAAGGETVTINGLNFQPGAVVTFGQETAAVVSNQANQLVVTTPVHYPWLVDVRVTNPNDGFAHEPNAYAYRGATAALTLPQATYEPGDSIQVDLNADMVGFLSANMEMSFDPAVLEFDDAIRGTLNGDAFVSVSENPAGRLIAVIAGIQPATGSGSILRLNFNVIGAPGSSSTLTVTQASLNDGMIPWSVTAGEITVDNTFNLAGTASYFSGGVLTDTTLDLTGSQNLAAATNEFGVWALADVAAGSYLLTPQKSGDDRNAVSALDASRVLDYLSGQSTLDEFRQIAADVNRINGINAADVSLILQKSVGLIPLPFPGNTEVWNFLPGDRSYQPLAGDQTDQDFVGILIGDVTGNWGQQAVALGGSLTLSLPTQDADPAEEVVVDLNAADVTLPFSALDLVMTYDHNLLDLTGVTTPLNGLAVHNETEPGRVNIALAAQDAVDADATLLQLSFTVANHSGSAALTFVSASIDEGAQNAVTQNGAVNVTGGIHFPDPVFRDFVLARYDGDSDGQISLEEAAAVSGFMICTNLGIESLDGVQYFVNLRGLYCEGNLLTQLPDLSNLTHLAHLRCFSNRLTQLPDLSALTNLTLLYCFSNQLTVMPDLSNLTRLERLYVMSNRFTSLPDLSGLTALKDFQCHYNQITELPDMSGLNNLEYFHADNNMLTRFPDLTGFPSLRRVSMHNNIFDADSCANIVAAQALGLESFAYNPQRGGGELNCPSCEALAFTAQPAGETTCLDGTVTLAVAVTGTGPVSYQWRRNGVDIVGADSQSLVLADVTPEDAGVYTCAVENACSSLVTQEAAVVVENCGVDILFEAPQSLLVTEAGGLDAFQVRLGAAPTAPVTLTFGVDDTSEARVDPPQLTFTAQNWSQRRTVLVRGEDDNASDGDAALTLITHAAVSADSRYQGLDPADLTIINVDDDTVGQVIFEAPRHIRAEAAGATRIPLRIGEVDGVMGMQWALDYNPALMTWTGYDEAGLLLAGWTITAVETEPGRLLFGAFSSEPLNGSGVLLYLDFTAANSAVGTSAVLDLSNVQFDAGYPVAKIVPGRFTIADCQKGDPDGDGISTQRDAALALSQVVGRVHWDFPALSETCVDVNCNGSVEAVDARLISRHALGLETGFCQEPVGLGDDQAVLLTLTDAEVQPGESFQLHLKLEDVSPQMILEGLQLKFNWDPQRLTLTGVVALSQLAELDPVFNQRVPGELRLAGFDINGVALLTGPLLTLNLRANGPGGVTDLQITQAGFNAGEVQVTSLHGRVHVAGPAVPSRAAQWPDVDILDLVGDVNLSD